MEPEVEKKPPIMNLPSVLDTFNPLKKFYASINKTKPKQALNIERIVKEQAAAQQKAQQQKPEPKQDKGNEMAAEPS